MSSRAGTGAYAALTYYGDCTWQPLDEPAPSDPPKELPTTKIKWLGASDELDAFLASMPVGSSYLGGYIIDRTPAVWSEGMHTVEFLVARAPDFTVAKPENGVTLKTATLTAAALAITVDGLDTSPVDGKREVTFYSPETSYSYFASSMPDGPRFTTVALPLDPHGHPRVLRSIITASAGGKTVTFAGTLAPVALVTALDMPPVEKVTSHRSEEIVGTPWFRCTDVVSRELQGDT